MGTQKYPGTHPKIDQKNNTPVQWLYEKGISYKFEFLRRQYHAGSLNFLIETLFARGTTVFAIARATW